jgi:uncharacterized protein
MAAHFELKKTTNGQFMFNLKAGNGEIILTGSMHKDKEAATRDIEVVRNGAANEARYERKTASNGQHFFVLKSETGDTAGRSEQYASASGMENGIASVKKNAPAATVKEAS